MKRLLSWKKSLSVLLAILIIAIPFYTISLEQAHAGLLTSGSIQLSDPRPSNAGTTYTVTYTFPGTTSIKCINIIFGNTTGNIILSANPSTTAPTGLTTTSAVKTSLSGGGLTNGNWTLYNSTNGILQYEYSTGEASTATSVTITTNTITNPSVGTFYAQVATYSSLSTHTCSTLVDNSNLMALTTTGGVSTSVTVDPTISFSVAGSSGVVNGGPASNAITTGSSIAFGSVAAGGSATSAAQLLTTSTNAAHGYNIYIRDTQALTNSNSDTVRDQTGTPGSPNDFDGTTSQSSFAYTTNSSTVVMGSNKWAGLTQTNVSLDNQTTAQNATTLGVEYQLEMKNTQPPGTYSNVITYTATPTY